MTKEGIQGIEKQIKDDIKVKYDNKCERNDETVATKEATGDCVEDAIGFAVDQMRLIPYNIRSFYAEFKCIFSNIEWQINSEVFMEIIRHLRYLGEQKREHRKVGANIVVFSKKENVDRCSSVSGLPDDFINKPEMFRNNINLERAYQYTNLENAFFAFYNNPISKAVEFLGIKNFINGDTLFERMLAISNHSAISFSLGTDSSGIRIFYEGKHCVDYFLSEATGSWNARFPSILLEHFQNIGLTKEDENELVKYVVDLSYRGIGTMLIVTRDVDRFNGTDISINLKDRATYKHINNIASIDGAIIIEKGRTAQIRKIGVILDPPEKISDEYKKLITRLPGGSRHKKAVQHACNNLEDCIIVISENKTVSILKGDRPVYWKDQNCIKPNLRRKK